MAQYFQDVLYSITNCLSCFPGTPQLRINDRSFKIQRLLGEGGFSYVYLVLEISTGAHYALKKIRCPFGQESVSLALKEVEAYSLFTPNPNIIRCIDHCIVADRSDPGAKTVYILLPYYRRGNLQDIINANLVNGTKFGERELMVLFLGVCKALRGMHGFRVDGLGKRNKKTAREVRDEAKRADEHSKEEMKRAARGKSKNLEDDVEQAEPLMYNAELNNDGNYLSGEVRAYAHRDIKPGNIMIDDDGIQPILMDLGSLSPSPVIITSRSMALAVQDQAAEHSTLPYRAPELFDVKTGSTIDTKVDVWSLGCTLFACLVGKSPFEMRSDETGGSLNICILSGDWRWPDAGMGKGKKIANQVRTEEDSGVSEGVREVVKLCLQVEPADRPDVDELIAIVEGVIEGLAA